MQKRRKTKHFWKFDATSAQNCEMWTLEHTPFAIECLAIYKDKLALNSWRGLFFLSLAKIYTILNHKTCHRRRCNVCTLLLPPVSFLPLFFRDFFSQKLQEFILYIFFSSHTQRKKVLCTFRFLNWEKWICEMGLIQIVVVVNAMVVGKLVKMPFWRNSLNSLAVWNSEKW